MAAAARIREYEPGETLFHEGDPATAVFIGRRGSIKLTQVGPDGHQVVLRLVCPDDKALLRRSFEKWSAESRYTRFLVPKQRLTDDELDSMQIESTRAIDIEQFVDLSEIDPVFYDAAYYVAPDKLAQKPYALLVQAMQREGKVAIARFTEAIGFATTAGNTNIVRMATLGRARAKLNIADYAGEQDLVLVCVLKRNVPAGGAQANALAKILDRWIRDNPRPYVGQHWPT